MTQNMTSSRTTRRQFAAFALAAFAPLAALAQATPFPTKPIKLVVPTGAGGGTDLVSRAFAQEMQAILGQAVVIENKPGAGGVIGTSAVKSATPDGYTLLVGNIGTHNTNRYLFASLPYDADRDFAPVSMFGKVVNIVVVPKDLPVRTLPELVAYARKKPGALNFAVGQIGSSSHLATETFRQQAGIDIVRVNYRGSNEAQLDVLTGRVQISFAPIVGLMGDIASGRLKALAQTSSRRLSILPDVPTVAESGYPGFEATGWFGLFAPAKTPPAVVEKLSAAARQAGERLNARHMFADQGVEIVTGSPAEFARFIEQDRAKWAPVIRAAGIKPE